MFEYLIIIDGSEENLFRGKKSFVSDFDALKFTRKLSYDWIDSQYCEVRKKVDSKWVTIN